MATKAGKTTDTARARRPARGAPSRASGPADVEETSTGARALIRAGLKALGDVSGDMVSRQSRVFEVLLGIGQSPAWKASGKRPERAAAIDPFGKFEDVFDERVARSLERMGMPTPEALRELTEQVRELNALLRAAPPKTPRKR